MQNWILDERPRDDTLILCSGWAGVLFARTWRSLCALQARLLFVLSKDGLAPAASLSLEELLHQLLPSGTGPGRPQGGAFPQPQRAQQPCIVQEGGFDELMCECGSRRTCLKRTITACYSLRVSRIKFTYIY